MSEFETEDIDEGQRMPAISSAWSTEIFRFEPFGEYLWRYVPFFQMVDLLVRQKLYLVTPSAMGSRDPLDGRLCSGMFDADVMKMINAVQKHGKTIDRDKARAITRDAIAISCWTEGDPSYQMWSAFSEMQWGVCLRVKSKNAVSWAIANALEYGPIFYPEMCNRETPVEYLHVHEQSTVYRPPKEIPLAWVKDPFFRLEREFRFAKRVHLPEAVNQWVSGEAIAPTQTIPFKPFDAGPDGGPMLDGIELAPFATPWYLEIVQETVRHLANQGATGSLQPIVARCEAGNRMNSAHGDAETFHSQLHSNRGNWFRFPPKSK